MRNFLASSQIHIAALCFNLLWLCSCATANSPRSNLPVDAPMNTRAGRGDYLFIELHSASGQPMVFAVDTGCYLTIFDKTLEATLGEPIGQERLRYGWAQHISANRYQAPKLFLGQTELQLGSYVVADDIKKKLGRPAAGILGMDCLSHYCVQLDFTTRAIRFLDPKHLNMAGLGEAFPLTNDLSELTVRADALGFHNLRFHVDTGDFESGLLKPEIWQTSPFAKPDEAKQVNGKAVRRVLLTEMSFGTATYSNVIMKDCSVGSNPRINLIGLQFLARNQVTFNFPKQTMYLQPTSAETLLVANTDTNTLNFQAARFIANLKQRKELPGWENGGRGGIQDDLSAKIFFGLPLKGNARFRNFRQTFAVMKTDDSSLYHYTVFRAAPTDSWQLEKAWRTDLDGKIVEEYPIK